MPYKPRLEERTWPYEAREGKGSKQRQPKGGKELGRFAEVKSSVVRAQRGGGGGEWEEQSPEKDRLEHSSVLRGC